MPPLRRLIFVFCVCAFLFSLALIFAQEGGAGFGTDIDALNAEASFRVGLEAYNRYAFNEAILSFEKALSFKPGEPLLLDWLGKAYYRSGLEETAIRQWEAAFSAYPAASPESVLIGNRIEVVSNRRSLFPSIDDAPRYVETGVFHGKYDDVTVFRHPSAVLPRENGSFWAVAYGSNEILLMDANGIVRRRERGPLAGFDRPFDIARGLDGRLYVSEFRGGRVSVLDGGGRWLSYIGKKGFHEGDLAGPAALAVDDEGYIYVSEFGNRRISKFSPDGEFINVFGRKDSFFPGFTAPAGIAVKNGILYAADSAAKKIYMFDKNAMYLGVLQEDIENMESMHLFPDGSLLISGTNKLLLLNTDSAVFTDITAQGNSRIRYTGAALDKNGDILAANFSEGEIAVLSSMDDIASGLFVQIERIMPDEFPKVYIEVSVQNSKRKPIIGLDESNFSLSERGNAAAEAQFLGSSDNARDAALSILIERSPATEVLKNALNEAVRDINEAVISVNSAPAEGGAGSAGSGIEGVLNAPVPPKMKIASIVSASSLPFLEQYNSANLQSLSAAARGGSYSARWRFDSALRLAATTLLPEAKKRSVIFISSGTFGQFAFEQYSLSELASYMANNGIKFYCVLAGAREVEDGIKYLCGETGGEVVRLYRAQGIASLIKSLIEVPSSTYSFSYKSLLPTNFGKAFLPVDVEVRFLERSGRDESGYFAPLE